ncbi:MAG: flagellar basal body-associated FliL family protein [Succinivibrio sp.]|nr:flagellar basal body-associated FliL family protein [Succinivibrio sp.]
MFNLLKIFGLVFLLWGAQAPMVYASGHGEPEEPAAEEEEAAPEISYYNITPDFTTNVATMSAKERPHYIRVKVSLMLGDGNDTSLIAEMEPVIKDTIVTVLGSKEYSFVSGTNGREKLRAECRDKLVSIMQEKVGRQVIDDVLFLSFMAQ